MWVVMGDEWCERQLNRGEHNEDFSEQEFARSVATKFTSPQAGNLLHRKYAFYRRLTRVLFQRSGLFFQIVV